MKRSIVAALLMFLGSADIAPAQILPPPVIGPRPIAPPVNCMPGQFCPAQARFGFRCQTPQFWCGMQQPGPVGGQCFCNSPYGVLVGIIVQ